MQVVEGRLSRDTDIFNKMDPYVALTLGDQKFKTKTMRDAGKNPVWKNEVFTIDVKSTGEELRVQVLDADPMNNDLVGNAQILLS